MKPVDTALERARANSAKAEENRAAMPQVSAWVDELRQYLGFGIRVAWASENGRERGAPRPEGIPAAESWSKLKEAKR